MEIILNGEKEVLDRSKSINELLEGLELNPAIVSVELNGKILQKNYFGDIELQPGDKVEVLLFMGGGW